MGSAPLTNFVNQVLPNQGILPYVQQQNFAQMQGWVSDNNPDLDFSSIQVIINNVVRVIYDRRTWYGLMIRGQIATSGFTIGGSVNITQGSNQIQGVGTSWTPAVIGQCFRLGYNTPPYVIKQLDVTNQIITIEMPWAGVSYTGAGYFLAQYYYSPGPNVKYLHTCRNLIMAWRMRLDYTQQTLDSIDPWRINVFSPSCLAQLPPDQNGAYQVELWPVPSIIQALPFIAVVQPPNLVNDTDSLPPYIRTDIVTKMAIADAKVYRGPKLNKYYDMAESQRLRGEAEVELNHLALADENLYRQSLLYEIESMRLAPMPGMDSSWAINHGVQAGYGNWDW
jgi:hypothetical protein